MPTHMTVTQPHTASYADTISVKQGQVLALSGREDIWDGHRWLWAVAPDGREGWVPDSLIRQGDAGPVAATDYAAVELTCAKGETLCALNATHGWVWCRNALGAEGWVPARQLRNIEPT